MASTNFLGVGSNLPFDQWLAVEREGISQKLNPYLQKQSTFQGQISAWGSISSALSTMKDNLGKLENEGFNGVSVSDNKTFKATAGSGAIPNSYSIAVKQLAKAQQLAVENDTRDKPIGNADAKVTITLKEGEKPLELELKSDETSLDQIAKKINDRKGDVVAEVITIEDGKHKLVLTSKKTGEAGDMAISVTGNSQLKSKLEGATVETASQNAELFLNGKPITRSSNTISDMITGVTLELREVSELNDPDLDPDDPLRYKTESLTITEDTSKVKTLIEEFVKNYNSYLSTVASATKYTAPDRESQSTTPDSTNGALFSDGSLRRLTSQLKSTVGGNYPDADALIQSLGSIGITVKFDGKIGDERSGALGELSIDTKKLDAALKDNPKAVEALFLGKDGKEGIKDRMEGIFDTYLGDKDAITKKEGVIETALESLREQDKRIGKQITAMERRIEEAMARKEKEFQRLDKVISDMNNMSSQLQGSLAGLI
ncbi:TPA: flagellar filament capping protein FliD [Enterobacter ludwigii]|uniref:flagellar filament capping protein FliD n=1 Tax=Enterobacter TaxID=547 RepID=UPI0015F40FF0|nr:MULTISPECIES: flagellar filament capping protein FliD [Enterobacter]MBA7773728.1 flagellar filament capping protein FliD [Enterobacter sp. RHBSTW-00974]MBA7778891.1 flagellar filament capping protein FliD [Enterobacter sp. RHBSTW-00318]MBA7831494.1 flagellar filament capping protein FliD [Enterobacter sp. RHBSTW-00340]MBA8039005.1 flagellar filament capping protein FliD [Enterobacter sp. RHBSTW-00131]MBG0585251.1 flagellar filament capping protein FliD [Enterobacter ludwigii]